MPGHYNIARNKELVLSFFKRSEETGLLSALEVLSDRCRWTSTSGSLGKSEMASLVAFVDDQLTEPLKIEIDTMTAEENRVAVEAHCDSVRKSGVIYKNTYHFLFFVSDGEITQVNEHCDTAHAIEVWSDLAPQ